MEKHKKPYTISRPQLLQTTPGTHPAPVVTLPSNGMRPLSDISELSEPSVVNTIIHRANNTQEPSHRPQRPTALVQKDSINRGGSAKSKRRLQAQPLDRSKSTSEASSSYSSTPEQLSSYSIPYSNVPRRSSSQTRGPISTQSHARKPSIRVARPLAHTKFEGFTVPNRGQSRSPVKVATARSDAVDSNIARRVPSQTYIREPCQADILAFPTYRHPRVKLDLRVSAPLFIGGGSIEGQVKITIDENQRTRSRRSLAIGALSVDLVGFEDMPNGRRAPFLAVGTELIDTSHPPPGNMTEPPNPLDSKSKFWTLTPSSTALPFMISLPLDTGPPPFQSKIANVRFLLCVTTIISDAGKHYRVRTSQDVCVIATYDPEKALTSLSSPLVAFNEAPSTRFGRCESIKVTAGLHRQVWVSGSSIFADVHIVNNTHKPVKRLELSLERNILCYKHTPAGTSEKSASQARIFERNEQTILTRVTVKPGQQGWSGVQPQSTETRTYELELPRGHATVRCGKYFEVRFFLNTTVSLSNAKCVSVQLPIVLIHMNSLDVLPNAVAQVAAAIEEKRAQSGHERVRAKQLHRTHLRQRSNSSPAAMADLRRRPSYSQGRAFAAPRQQPVTQQQAVKSDLDDLQQTLDSSPRKFEPQVQGAVIKKVGNDVSVGTLSLGGKKSGTPTPPSYLSFRTPLASHSGKSTTYSQRAEEDEPQEPQEPQKPLPRMQSLDSIWSKRSKNVKACVPGANQNVKPQYSFKTLKKRRGPPPAHLNTINKPLDMEASISAVRSPATRSESEENTPGDRVEVKGVGQKPSGSLRERSANWLEQVRHREREKDGWI